MQMPEPDTHCYDDDTQKDVWSYSKELVEQVLSERDAVLKQALEAMEGANPLMECYWGNNASETIAAIKKVLG